ncbi:hypothetical protein [Streptomyces candidus]|uniref:DNA-binding HxlR family transcriptional regulator n=1 Tax=Streptomyces candidus TaxID=67283 RepID=A0A7X0HM90_9ACTN|nr:hypothetical protein [Streptomyces candidus]MBB6440120.1 DNA-binding HxlR family transcriptional regulator [Streptomyces candidus]GHH58277.1 hypothetical protein GCM10018773_66410 [Streptomyces candidus]
MTEPPPLTGATAHIIRLLAERPRWVGEIAKKTTITGDTLTRALRRLLDEKWATVTHEKGSERGWLPQRRYALTKAGRDIARRLGDTTEAS